MRLLNRVKSALKSMFRKERLDRELGEELESYLDLLTEEKIEQGMSHAQARRTARLELGGVEQVKESVRENRFGAALDILLQDVRYACRTMRRNSGSTLVAVLILAIGIGSTTALFSAVNTALLRRMPFTEPDRLIAALKTLNGRLAGSVARLDYYDYRQQTRSFEELAALTSFTMTHTILGGSEPTLAEAGYVTWNLFRTLGVEPVVGRSFVAQEEQGDGAPVLLISHRFWQRYFGGSSQAIGSSLNVDGVAFTVIGVMPPGFRFVHDPDLWRLVHRNGPYDLQRDSHSHIVVGRLKPGVSITQAQADCDTISAGLAEQYPDTNEGKGLRLTDLRGYLVYYLRTMLVVLMATTGLVLLIACGNVAGLLLARGQRRSAEMAMRASLGASRGRLVRQLLTESIVLTLLAGTAGIGVAVWFQQLVLRVLPMAEMGIGVATIDGATLLFALSVSVATGLVVGVIPALRGTTLNLADQLKPGTHITESRRGTRLRNGLVVFQVAVSIVLLIGSGLLARSLVQLASVELGFEPERLLTGQVQVIGADYPDRERRRAFFASLLEEIETLPGVTSASTINKLPILDRWQDWGIWRADGPEPTMNDDYSAMARWVSPGYFATMGIPLLQGRDISETDVAESPRVVVISRRVAERLFPDDDAIGQAVLIAWGDTPLEVVGIVGDAYLNTLRGGIDGAFYLSSAQVGATRLRIAVRTAGDPTLLVEPIRRLVRQKDPNALFAAPRTMTSIVDGALADFRLVIFCLGLFASIALLLTAIGLYGVLAYYVSQRSKEIGIRLAMGAAPRNVLGMILGRGLRLVAIGLPLGLAGGFSTTLLLDRLLFETAPLDAVTYVGAALFLMAVSMMACLIPASRAARLSPVDVLRGE